MQMQNQNHQLQFYFPGTLTSENIKECVSDPRIPFSFFFIPISKPAQPFSTIKALIPLCPFSISV
jgi:hypothetical protein